MTADIDGALDQLSALERIDDAPIQSVTRLLAALEGSEPSVAGPDERFARALEAAELLLAAERDDLRAAGARALEMAVRHRPAELSAEAKERLANLLRFTGRFADALPLTRDLTAAQDQSLDICALHWSALGECLWHTGSHAEALDAYIEASRLAHTSTLAPADRASIDGNLAAAAKEVGNHEVAHAALLRVLAWRSEAFAAEPLQLIQVLTDLAELGFVDGAPDRALPYAERAWHILKDTLVGNRRASDMPVGANIVGVIGTLHWHRRDLLQARAKLEESRIRFRALEDQDGEQYHPVTMLDALMWTYAELGETRLAVTAARELVEAAQGHFGPDHPSTARAWTTLGTCLYDDKDRAGAEDAMRRAIAIGEPHGASPELGTRYVNLAKLLIDQDRLREAEQHMTTAEKIFGDAPLPARRRDLAFARATWLRRQQRTEDAVAEVGRSIALSKEAYGERSRQLVTPLLLLAALRAEQRRWTEARAVLQQALGLEGLTDLQRASTLHNLGDVALKMGDLAAARSETEEALRLKRGYGEDHPRLAPTLANLGAIERNSGRRDLARPLLEKGLALEVEVFGPASSDVALTRANLAGVLAGEGDLEAARQQLAAVLATQTARLDDLLALNIDSQRVSILRDLAHELDAYVGLSTLLQSTGPEAVRKSYAEVAARKGLATEALAQELLRKPADKPLTGSSRADLSELCNKLPKDSVLLDYIAFGTARLTTGPSPRVKLPEVRRYGVFVIGPEGSIALHDLGTAVNIDRAAFEVWRALAAREPYREVRRKGAQLAALLLPAELVANLPRQILVSPDGAINNVSFAALPLGVEGNDWLADRCEIVTIGSARELLQKFATVEAGPPVVLAGPDYSSLHPSPWSSLPGAAREGEAVARTLGVAATTDKQATAAALFSAHRPRILHVAAHGFYFEHSPEPQPQWPHSLRTLMQDADPFGRSGLALTPDPDAEGDAVAGIVTARRIIGLDLTGTEVVTLSACDTGRGAPEPLDGAHGLRRALRAAGAATIVVSLWPVDDDVTVILMRAFYDGLQRGLAPASALAAASRSVRANERHPSKWAPFIAYGPGALKLPS